MSRSYKKRPYFSNSEWNKGFKRSYNKSLRKKLKQDITTRILRPVEDINQLLELEEIEFENHSNANN